MTKTLTPAQQQGFEIGKLYRLNTDIFPWDKEGDVVQFHQDDGSERPYFLFSVYDGLGRIDLSALHPYNYNI